MNIPIDKKAHFLAGAAISGVLSAYGIDPLVAFGISAFCAGVKEFVDRLGYGTPDLWDFLVTVAGGAIVLPLAI